ncbi:MAG: lipoprotein-releasing ABC transporter permease subunit [Acidobacteriaceae bacterium]
MRFELFIAARYLRAKRRQAVVGVITAISVIGVAAGVASLIIALAITNGMRRDLQERLVGSTAHVELERVKADGIRDWQPLVDRLRKLPHVTGAAPGFYGQVLISRGARSGGGLIAGIIPTDQRTVTDLLSSIKQGSADALEPAARSSAHSASTPATAALPPIVIGKDLADSIGAGINDTVWVTSPQGPLTPLGVMPIVVRYQVVGIFQSGFYQYDSSHGFVRLADAQRLFSDEGLISVVWFRVDDMYRANLVGKQIADEANRLRGPGFETTNWMEQNRELFRALKLEQIVTFIVLALIVCVAALNILIALTMMVMEKTRDIAVLMSFGVRIDQIRRIFLMQGLLISVIGTVIGLVLGYAVSWLGGHYRFIHLDASVYSIDYLPFAPRVTDALIVATVSLGVSLIATIYPSSSAAKVLPAEALRYE